MTTVVFGIEIYVHKIEYITVNSFPSLNVIVDNKEPKTILPFKIEAHPNDVWEVEKAYQIIDIIDAFENCVSCPITFELVSPVETTALGRCTLELKPLICDAIAAHGYSPIASQTTYFKDFERHEVASITFDIRTILFQLCLRRAATTNSRAKKMSKSSKTHQLSGRSMSVSDTNIDNEQDSVRQVRSYKNLQSFLNDVNFPQDVQRRKSFNSRAGTALIGKPKRNVSPALNNIGTSFD